MIIASILPLLLLYETKANLKIQMPIYSHWIIILPDIARFVIKLIFFIDYFLITKYIIIKAKTHFHVIFAFVFYIFSLINHSLSFT